MPNDYLKYGTLLTLRDVSANYGKSRIEGSSAILGHPIDQNLLLCKEFLYCISEAIETHIWKLDAPMTSLKAVHKVWCTYFYNIDNVQPRWQHSIEDVAQFHRITRLHYPDFYVFSLTRYPSGRRIGIRDLWMG